MTHEEGFLDSLARWQGPIGDVVYTKNGSCRGAITSIMGATYTAKQGERATFPAEQESRVMFLVEEGGEVKNVKKSQMEQ